MNERRRIANGTFGFQSDEEGRKELLNDLRRALAAFEPNDRQEAIHMAMDELADRETRKQLLKRAEDMSVEELARRLAD